MSKKEKPRKLTLKSAVVGLLTLLMMAQLMISHHLATQGEQLRQLELRAKKIEQENAILKEEIARAGSLSKLAQEAKKIGLVRANHVLYLTPQLPVALGKSDLPLGR